MVKISIFMGLLYAKLQFMQITVIGTGFVGVVTSAVLAAFDHKVTGLDIDKKKVDLLNTGIVPFFEPGLKRLLKQGLKSKRLSFSTSYAQTIPNSQVIIIAVGTPSAPDGTADLTYVLKASESLAPYIKDKTIIAIKSTVPPGTTALVKKVIETKAKGKFFVAALPEFLREGTAVHDTLHPNRILIGSEDTFVIRKLLKLHEPLGGKRLILKPESANMAKYTANAYLAMRITFINQIANLCEKNGAKISEVIEAIGLDKRIGLHYWYPGLGYGGSCFPKDVKELAAYAKSVGEGNGLLVKIDELNESRVTQKLNQFNDAVGGFAHKKVAVLGLSFKQNTNDIREAPSLKVIPYLLDHQAKVSAFDPQANALIKTVFPQIELCDSPDTAVKEAEVIMLLVEWTELTRLNLKRMAELAKKPCYFIDTRNQYSGKMAEEAGFIYISIGNS